MAFEFNINKTRIPIRLSPRNFTRRVRLVEVGQFLNIRGDIAFLDLFVCFLGEGVKNANTTNVRNMPELFGRNTEVTERITFEKLRNVWRKFEYRLHILHATKGVYVQLRE